MKNQLSDQFCWQLDSKLYEQLGRQFYNASLFWKFHYKLYPEIWTNIGLCLWSNIDK